GEYARHRRGIPRSGAPAAAPETFLSAEDLEGWARRGDGCGAAGNSTGSAASRRQRGHPPGKYGGGRRSGRSHVSAPCRAKSVAESTPHVCFLDAPVGSGRLPFMTPLLIR